MAHWSDSLKKGDKVVVVERDMGPNVGPNSYIIEKVDTIKTDNHGRREVVISKQSYINGQCIHNARKKIEKVSVGLEKKAKETTEKEKLLSYTAGGIGHVIGYEKLVWMTVPELKMIAKIMDKVAERRGKKN